jgi:hypothetical protein
VEKYRASRLQGNRLKQVREDAKLHDDAILELTEEAKQNSKEEAKAGRKAEREARKAAKAKHADKKAVKEEAVK